MTNDVMPGRESYSHEGNSHGVLVLHGFTGSPPTVRSLAERCAEAGYSVELPRLPGHGTTVEDMMTTTWSDWSATAEEAFDALAQRCEKVAIVGLSMGGGLTAYVAERRPEVAGCVFINPILTLPPAELVEGLTQLLDAGVESFESIGSDIKKEGGDGMAYDSTPLRPLKTLFEGIVGVNENLVRITAPSLLLTSREDHVVMWDNASDFVAKVSGPVEQVWLEDSYHVATLDNDQELVESLTLDFLSRVFS